MNRRTWCLHGVLVAGLCVALCSGCGSKPATPVAVAPTNGPEPTVQNIPGPPATIPGPPPANPTATIPGPPASIPGPPTETPVAETPSAEPGALKSFVPSDGSPTPPPPPPSTPQEIVKADVGVGIKGRSLDPHEGVLVTPAKAYFAVREKVVFQIQIPQAIQLYKAENPIPLTFDEFKLNILDPNKIKLPPLPPGHTYEWDPEQEQLMVKRPVKP